ncbi:MAG: TetR/AcrR family transcriptional regulator [Flavobacteriaceae bacterium]|nr:TetR/AcrR family transcriptional regulator [Flavobacteriaceae bacterium]
MKPRKKQILNTAAKLFKKRGYSAVTMRDLAEALNMKAASLYNHISSKQELLATLIISLAETFTQQMQNILEQDSTSIQKIKNLIDLHIDLTLQNPDAMACLNNDWMHLEEQLPYFIKMRQDYENQFKKLIAEGISQKQLSGRNPEILLFSLLTTLRSLPIWLPKKSSLENRQLKKELRQSLLYGIVKIDIKYTQE